MGNLGTSHQEEQALRDAQRQSISSHTNSSAYETADELTGDEHHINSRGELVRDSSDGGNDNDDAETIDQTVVGETTVAETSVAAADATVDAEVDADDTVRPFTAGPRTSTHSHIEPEFTDNENELNRRYTLERLHSHKSVEEAADEDLVRSLPHHQPKHEFADDKSTDQSSGEAVTKEGVEVTEINVENLDWDGPDDPANPANWSNLKRWIITFTVAIVCLCCSLGSSLFVSGVPEMMVRFNTSQELCLAGLTLYLVGLALGPVLTSPLSEVIGRRWIYITSFPVSMLFTMGVGLSKNMRTILVLRFFTGYFASPALSIAGGSIADLWALKPEEMSVAISLFCLAPFLGPVIGPIVGGFAAEHKNWQWSAAWVSLMFSGAVLPFLLWMPETYKPIILKNRAAKRGITVIKPEVNKEYVKKMANFVLLRPLEMLVLEPIVCIISIYIAFVFAVLFGFFEAFPIIFRGVYHMGLGVSGLPFIGVGLGMIGAVFFQIIIDKVKFFPKNPDGTRGKRDAEGNIIWDAPEKKLFVGKVGAVCLPISLFWLGWTSRKSIHWICPILAGIPFGFGMVLIFFSAVLYFSMAFPPISVASALAANNLLRYILASVFPLFTVQMYERLHINWASSLLGFISLAMVPVPFVFERYGAKLRAKSRFGYAAYFKQLAEKKAQEEAATSHGVEEVAANKV